MSQTCHEWLRQGIDYYVLCYCVSEPTEENAMNAHLSGCIAAACVLCAVVFLTDPAFAQGNAPEITIVGRGTDPVRVFVDGVAEVSLTLF